MPIISDIDPLHDPSTIYTSRGYHISHEFKPAITHGFALAVTSKALNCPEQGVKLLGLLLTGSTGQHMAGRNGLA
jgi:hypothetical protein